MKKYWWLSIPAYSIFFIALNIFFLSIDASVSFWFSDKFFSFFMAPLILFIFTLFDFSNNIYVCVREKSRLIIIVKTILVQLMLSIIFAAFFFFNAIIVVLRPIQNIAEGLPLVFEWTVKYMLGSALTSVLLNLLVVIADEKTRSHAPYLLYVYMVFELSILTPKSAMLSGTEVRIMFSWLFSNHAFGILIAFLWALFSLVCLLFLGNRKDII